MAKTSVEEHRCIANRRSPFNSDSPTVFRCQEGRSCSSDPPTRKKYDYNFYNDNRFWYCVASLSNLDFKCSFNSDNVRWNVRGVFDRQTMCYNKNTHN